MKAKGKVLKAKDNFIMVKLASKDIPKVGDVIDVKFGETRTIPQNSLYWSFLTWCVNNGLKEHGFYCVESLHESLKAKFLDEKVLDKGILKSIAGGSTTDLDKKQMSEYTKLCDVFIVDFFWLDTSVFWEMVESHKQVNKGT